MLKSEYLHSVLDHTMLFYYNLILYSIVYHIIHIL